MEAAALFTGNSSDIQAPTKPKKDKNEFKREGIAYRIRPTLKNGTKYFVCDHRVRGERKLVWRPTFAYAKQAAEDAIDKIATGQGEVLQFTNAHAHEYLRAKKLSDSVNLPLDHIARDFAELLKLLAGRTTPIKAIRDWLKRHDSKLPEISLLDARDEFIKQMKADGKSRQQV